jgi:phosphatidylserine decarboxylase
VIAFLSPLNMHTQKCPASGTVVSITHKPGEFNPAYILQKTELNERTTTVFATKYGLVTVIQVAGQLARRIVTMVQPGDDVDVGKTFGLIKAGSQCRVRAPPGFKCLTQLGAKIRAAETPIFIKV